MPRSTVMNTCLERGPYKRQSGGGGRTYEDAPVGIDKTRGDPLVLAVDDLHPSSSCNVLLDAGYSVALDEHVGLEDTSLIAPLD